MCFCSENPNPAYCDKCGHNAQKVYPTSDKGDLTWQKVKDAEMLSFKNTHDKFLGILDYHPVVEGLIYCNSKEGCHYVLKRNNHKDNGDWHSRGELPPVGTEVEYCGQDGAIEKQCYDLWKNGDTLEVLAHRIVFGTNTPIVFNKRTLDASAMDKKYLIPLKSERERAIEEMRKVVTGLKHDVCGALYDAGFRKEGK